MPGYDFCNLGQIDIGMIPDAPPSYRSGSAVRLSPAPSTTEMDPPTISNSLEPEMTRPLTPVDSYTKAPDSLYDILSKNKDITNINANISTIKGGLGNLEHFFDSLEKYTTQMIQAGGEFETAAQLNKVRQEMRDSDRKQEEQIEEIHTLLENALQTEIVEHLRELIEAGIMKEIDLVVKQKVAEELPKLIRRELQAEVTKHREKLHDVQCALHNSESRRANSLLRMNKPNEPLHTIYKQDGTISKRFPKTLQEFFSMDGETAKLLLGEYGFTDVSTSRERNINNFMQFVGVTYQLVDTSGGNKPFKISI